MTKKKIFKKSVFKRIFGFITTYVSYAMLIFGNLLLISLIAAGTPLQQAASAIFWVIVIDLASVALTIYYRKKPA
jgi:hypothetical protein